MLAMLDKLNAFAKKYKDVIDAVIKPIGLFVFGIGFAYITLWLQVHYVSQKDRKEDQALQSVQFAKVNDQFLKINEKLDLLLQDRMVAKEQITNLTLITTDLKERVLYLERSKVKSTP